MKIAAIEALWCYHKIHTNQSFNSSDCESTIIREIFVQNKFRLGRTKCAAITAGVFVPQIIDEMKKELEKCNFISLATDASNHNAIKMFPVVGRWFVPNVGIQTKVLDLTSQTGTLKKKHYLILIQNNKQ